MTKTIARGLLTILRAILILVVILQVMTIAPALTWLQAPANVTAEMLIVLGIKVAVGLIAVGGYIGLTKVSNKLAAPAP